MDVGWLSAVIGIAAGVVTIVATLLRLFHPSKPATDPRNPEAILAKAQAEAEAIRGKAEAESDAIRAKGEAEAERLRAHREALGLPELPPVKGKLRVHGRRFTVNGSSWETEEWHTKK